MNSVIHLIDEFGDGSVEKSVPLDPTGLTASLGHGQTLISRAIPTAPATSHGADDSANRQSRIQRRWDRKNPMGPDGLIETKWVHGGP